MSQSDRNVDLEEELRGVTFDLRQPQSSTAELLDLLDDADGFLQKIKPLPHKVTYHLVERLRDVLTAKDLLRHTNTTVRLSLASCLAEIARVIVPDFPFHAGDAKEVFQLLVESFGKLSQVSSQGYGKAESILKHFANHRISLMMLDLKLDELIVEMFQLLLRTVCSGHTQGVIEAMEEIMIITINESDEVTFDMLSPLLASVRKENQEVLPETRGLAAKVLLECAYNIKPQLSKAVESKKINLDEYFPVVNTIYKGSSTTREIEEFPGSTELKQDIVYRRNVTQVVDDISTPVIGDGTYPMDLEIAKRKRERKPNPLMMNPDEGYNHFWFTGRKTKRISEIKDRSLSSFAEVFEKLPLPLEVEDMSLPKEILNNTEEEKLPLPLEVEETSLPEKSLNNTEEEKLPLPIEVEEMSLPEEILNNTEEEKLPLPLEVEEMSFPEEILNNTEEMASTCKVITEASNSKTSGAPDRMEALVGRRIKVWWPLDSKFYECVVQFYWKETRDLKVVYDDGYKEVLPREAIHIMGKEEEEIYIIPSSLDGI